MLFQPFLARGAWPEQLRLPFYDASSVFYVGGVSESTFSLIQVSLYALVLIMVQILRSPEAQKQNVQHVFSISISWMQDLV